MFSAKQVNILSQAKGSFWQRNYYDHVIRTEDELRRIREYIVSNPSFWTLDEENPDKVRLKK
jgi:putative transposase